MSRHSEFTDEQLTAYLDGEVEHIPADAIRRALTYDSRLRARLEDLSIDKTQITAAFDQLLIGAPAMPDLPAVTSPIPTTPTWWQAKSLRLTAAAAVISLVIGWGAGYLTPRSDLATWQDFAAAYHVLYIDKTLAHINQSEADASAELAKVSGALGKNFDLASFTNIDGLDYKRAQILGYDNQPLIQLSFLTDKGIPIALCITRSQLAGNKNAQQAEMLGLRAANWTKDGFDYLLIGGSNAKLIKSAADAFARDL